MAVASHCPSQGGAQATHPPLHLHTLSSNKSHSPPLQFILPPVSIFAPPSSPSSRITLQAQWPGLPPAPPPSTPIAHILHLVNTILPLLQQQGAFPSNPPTIPLDTMRPPSHLPPHSSCFPCRVSQVNPLPPYSHHPL